MGNKVSWKTLTYGFSLLLILAGFGFSYARWPHANWLTNAGFSIFVALKIGAFFETPTRDWDWTVRVRLAIALLLAAMLGLRISGFPGSHNYFLLVLLIDYIVGRQLAVRRTESDQPDQPTT